MSYLKFSPPGRRLVVDGIETRPFGIKTVRTADFLAWAAQAGFSVRSDPKLEDYELARLEAVLLAIERADPVTPGSDTTRAAQESGTTAMLMQSIIEAGGGHMAEELRTDPSFNAFAFAAHSHAAWRERIGRAIETGALPLVDPITGDRVANDSALGARDEPETVEAPSKYISVYMDARRDWRDRVRARACEWWTDQYEQGTTPSLNRAAEFLQGWCRDNDVLTKEGTYPRSDYLRRHIISKRAWTPPADHQGTR